MIIKSQSENIRIDKYLSDKVPYSRETIVKMITNGKIKVSGKIVKPSYKIKLNDENNIEELPTEELIPQNIKLDIVYEDDDLMVINKPSGMVVHPGNGNNKNTLVNALLYYDENIKKIGDSDRPGIVHRLDKDTSGLMLVAKSKEAYEKLTNDFKNKKVHREYLALLEGNILKNRIVIDAPIGRDRNNYQKRMITSTGKKAITHLEVLKKYKEFTLVKAILETGRTHQIRVHTKYIGYPVFNDPLYGNKKATEFGQFLHSYYIEFNHPITNKKMCFTKEPPQEFIEFVNSLEEQK